jgi:hypothetical protein
LIGPPHISRISRARIVWSWSGSFQTLPPLKIANAPPTVVLHPFQVPGIEPPAEQFPMFQRGRLDHFALNAASEEAFGRLRERIVGEGAGDGIVTDMGSLLFVGFTDPDGGVHEVVWMKPSVRVEATLKRADWITSSAM